MIDLLYLARDNDLPPAWDGHHVEWEGWTDQPPIFLCGRGAAAARREVCPACGSTAPSVRNVGHYNLGRDWRTGYERTRRLVALRCPDCMHDQVWETWKNTWWDLDPSDYGDDGSRIAR